MAHEIGHLLGVGHSPTGIMCAHFGRKQFVWNGEGGLLFTVAEAAQIRAEITRLKAAAPLAPKIQGVKMQIEGGRPVVDGVYVNGQGPYRFIVDTGATLNLIETGLARKFGLNATSQVELTSSTGKSSVMESDGNAVTLVIVRPGRRYSGSTRRYSVALSGGGPNAPRIPIIKSRFGTGLR